MKVTNKICKNCIYYVLGKCLITQENTGMFSICKTRENFVGNTEHWRIYNELKLKLNSTYGTTIYQDINSIYTEDRKGYNMITIKQIENLASRYKCDISISGDGILVTFNKDTEKEMCHYISYEMEEAVDYFALAKFLEEKSNTVRFEDLEVGELFEYRNTTAIKTLLQQVGSNYYNAVCLNNELAGMYKLILPNSKVIKKGYYDNKDEN